MTRFRTKISFEGLNLTRTLNTLSQKYLLCDVVRQGKCCQITVPSKVFKEVVAFLEERCYNITNIQKIGADYTFSFLRRHFLLPLFLIVAVVLLAVSSNFCWKIEVSGDYLTEEVVQALKNCNVSVGTQLYEFSADRLENSLATQLDAMYAVVNRKGSTLYVNAIKKKSADLPIDMHTRRDIVATCGGTVVSVLCEQGTALVSVGDVVQAGDVLIEGLRTFNDGTTQNVYSLGKIIVRPENVAFAPFLGVVTETVETGNVFVSDSVVLFGKSYGKLPPFETYRTEQTEVRLYPLNLIIQRVTYYETQEVTKTVSIYDCLEELKLKALQQATAQAQFQVKQALYQIATDGVFVTVYGEIEIS